MSIALAIVVSMLLTAVPVIAADLAADVKTSAAEKKSSRPRLFVDTDPLTPGIQRWNIVRDSSFSIDIVVTGIDQARPLDVYEFSLSFNPNVIRPISVTSGGFLAGGVPILDDVTRSRIYWAEGVMGSPGTAGDGILATIMFEVIGTGLSRLDLSEAVLAGLGEEITARITDGTIRATRSSRR